MTQCLIWIYTKITSDCDSIITTQRVVLYFTNWQTHNTQCLILCPNSELPRPNTLCTKWKGLLNHLSFLFPNILQPQSQQDQRRRSPCTLWEFTSEPEPSGARVSSWFMSYFSGSVLWLCSLVSDSYHAWDWTGCAQVHSYHCDLCTNIHTYS